MLILGYVCVLIKKSTKNQNRTIEKWEIFFRKITQKTQTEDKPSIT